MTGISTPIVLISSKHYEDYIFGTNDIYPKKQLIERLKEKGIEFEEDDWEVRTIRVTPTKRPYFYELICPIEWTTVEELMIYLNKEDLEEVISLVKNIPYYTIDHLKDALNIVGYDELGKPTIINF